MEKLRTIRDNLVAAHGEKEADRLVALIRSGRRIPDEDQVKVVAATVRQHLVELHGEAEADRLVATVVAGKPHSVEDHMKVSEAVTRQQMVQKYGPEGARILFGLAATAITKMGYREA